MPIVSSTKMNARQYLQLGEDPPGVHLELVDGQIAVHATPLPPHGYAVVKLVHMLGTWSDQHAGGELLTGLDLVIGPHEVRRVDLVYFSETRSSLIRWDEALDQPPDLCVEVISAPTEAVDRIDKFNTYAQFSVNFYWIVDPNARTIEGYERVRSRYKPTGRAKGTHSISLPPFPGLVIPLGDLWFSNRKAGNR